MTQFPYAPGSRDIRRCDEWAQQAQQPYAPTQLEAEAKLLQQQIDDLLQRFSNHDIALCLQRSHNALSAPEREGYRMEIRMLSPAYQRGGYDAVY